MEKSIKNAFYKNGIRGVVKYCAQKLAGIEVYEEQIDTLHFFINEYMDISKFPHATGALRKLQEGDALLLAIIDVVCKKNSIDYWLDGGTCLGAVRHKGFIPWDDDVDICMMRDNYEKALEILPRELEKYEISASEHIDLSSRIGIGYKHKETGIWIDLLPCEYVSLDANDPVAFDDCIKRCHLYLKEWKKKRNKLSRSQVMDLRKRYIPEICDKQSAKSVLHYIEFASKPRLWPIDVFFPLSRMTFEELSFSVPNDTNSYLTQLYGKKYMGFPKSGLAHHGDERGSLITWAENSGTDMDQVIQELKSILSKINQDVMGE